jgi:hypothetical protein
MEKSEAAQRTALRASIVELAVSGKGPTEIARLLGISRTTVWRILKQPATVALLDQRRREVWGVVPDVMRAITLDALRVIGRSVRANDLEAARDWFRAVGRVITPALTDFGSDDPETLRATLLQQLEILDLDAEGEQRTQPLDAGDGEQEIDESDGLRPRNRPGQDPGPRLSPRCGPETCLNDNARCRRFPSGTAAT